MLAVTEGESGSRGTVVPSPAAGSSPSTRPLGQTLTLTLCSECGSSSWSPNAIATTPSAGRTASLGGELGSWGSHSRVCHTCQYHLRTRRPPPTGQVTSSPPRCWPRSPCRAARAFHPVQSAGALKDSRQTWLTTWDAPRHRPSPGDTGVSVPACPGRVF